MNNTISHLFGNLAMNTGNSHFFPWMDSWKQKYLISVYWNFSEKISTPKFVKDPIIIEWNIQYIVTINIFIQFSSCKCILLWKVLFFTHGKRCNVSPWWTTYSFIDRFLVLSVMYKFRWPPLCSFNSWIDLWCVHLVLSLATFCYKWALSVPHATLL